MNDARLRHRPATPKLNQLCPGDNDNDPPSPAMHGWRPKWEKVSLCEIISKTNAQILTIILEILPGWDKICV